MSLKVLVVASSFPALHQPWINTHLKQLEARGVKLEVLSFKEDLSESERIAAGDLMQYCRALTREPRRYCVAVFSASLHRPVQAMKWVLRALPVVMSMRVGFKERIKQLLFFLHLQLNFGRSDCDLMHVHFDQDVFGMLVYAHINSIPIVTTFHGLNPRGVRKLSAAHREEVYRAAELVFANTRFACEQAVALGCDERKVRILPQGLECERFTFCERGAPKSGEKLRLLTVGRLDRDKGQVYALLAARRMALAGIDFEWSFVGSGPDRRRLHTLVKRLLLSERVRFLEGLSSAELMALYEQSHLFVLPSTSNDRGYHVETQGVVLQEAQAKGCLVIASAVGGVPECIHDGIDGLLVPERSSRAIADKVIGLLNGSHDWQSLQQAGRRNVEERFSTELIGDRTVACYQEVLLSRSQGRSISAPE